MRLTLRDFAVLTAAAAALFAAPAAADIRQERICAGLEAGDAFAACSTLITTGQVDRAAIARAHANRAALWDRQGKPDQALADYDAALRFDGNLVAALYNRSAIFLKRREIDRALADLDRAVAADPSDAEVIFRRGGVWAERGDPKRAIADFDVALQLSPRQARVHLARAIERDKAGDLEAALADCDAAIALDANEATHFVARGALASRKGLVDKAIADFDVAIRLKPDFAPAYVNRASLLERKGERQRALVDYQAAARLNPDYAPAHNGVAWALLRLGRAAEALAHVEKALALDPNSAESLDTRAGILEALGKLPEAFADISRARSLEPKSPETLESFTRIKVKLDASLRARPVDPQDNKVLATAERRVALVIGNAEYRGISPLRNAVNDAEAVAAKLRALGFTSVTLIANGTRDEIMGKLAAFSREAEAADWAMVYYAGHGMQVDGVNWLIPIDASLRSDRDVKVQAISLEQINASVEGAKKLRLIVLDACRDNPFLANLQKSAGTRSLGRGLARVEPGATLIAFAAKENQVALDGEGRNSPFVTALLRHLGTPGLELDRLFRRVAEEVLRGTSNQQEPHTYGRLPDEDFFFVPPDGGKLAKAK